MQESDGAAAARTVLGWLQEAQQPGPGPEVHKAMGFMRWAFVHAFRCVCHLACCQASSLDGSSVTPACRVLEKMQCQLRICPCTKSLPSQATQTVRKHELFDCSCLVVSLCCVSWCCCRALHLQLGYQEAMEHVLLLGGDTDTNAGACTHLMDPAAACVATVA
jgi:hypothetical protein